MVVDSNGNGNAAECTECDPPRRFKSKAGLNGHTQFKHGHLPDNRAPIGNGKQSQMYQDLTDRVNQVLDRQDDIFDYLKHGNDNGLANGNGNGQGNGNGNGNGQGNGNGNGNGQVNGNGNGQVNGNGNGNGFSTEPIGVVQPPPEEPDTYVCGECKTEGKTTGLTPGQPYCGDCGQEIDWNGHDIPLDLDKSRL